MIQLNELSKGFATYFLKKEEKTVLVGYDNRISSEHIRNILVKTLQLFGHRLEDGTYSSDETQSFQTQYSNIQNKEKANWIYYLSVNFNVRVTIIKSKAKDKGFKRKLVSNMKYIESFLKTHDVEYEIITAEGKTSFKEEVVNFAKVHEFDIIMIMATRDIKLTDYLFGAPEQFIMSNEFNIPVMCVNPRPTKIASGFRASGG